MQWRALLHSEVLQYARKIVGSAVGVFSADCIANKAALAQHQRGAQGDGTVQLTPCRWQSKLRLRDAVSHLVVIELLKKMATTVRLLLHTKGHAFDRVYDRHQRTCQQGRPADLELRRGRVADGHRRDAVVGSPEVVVVLGP